MRSSNALTALVLCAALSPTLGACRPAPPPAPSAEAGKAFLVQNAKAPGVVSLPSGLEYKVVHSGPATGAHPGPNDEVKVNYEGKLIDGTVFDSSFKRGEPVDLPLQGLIPGWIEALQLMRPGDEWVLYVPSNLGYGEAGAGDGQIPPDSVLIFRIQLLDALQHPNGAALG